jgi:hypothetical protein
VSGGTHLEGERGEGWRKRRRRVLLWINGYRCSLSSLHFLSFLPLLDMFCHLDRHVSSSLKGLPNLLLLFSGEGLLEVHPLGVNSM